MLAVERQVTRALLAHPDAAVRERAELFVEASLGDMPEHLRAGVAVESVLVAALVGLAARRPSSGDAPVSEVLHRLENSRIGLLRQYPRLFRSLALFAECEASTAAVRT